MRSAGYFFVPSVVCCPKARRYPPAPLFSSVNFVFELITSRIGFDGCKYISVQVLSVEGLWANFAQGWRGFG